jgi:hypothetical protein
VDPNKISDPQRRAIVQPQPLSHRLLQSRRHE